MKIKKIAFILAFAVFTSLFVVPVSAQSACPINYSCFITHEDGVPSIHFKFLNNTIQTIVYAEYKATLFDVDFKPAYDTSNSVNSCRIKISNLNVSDHYDDAEIVTNLAAYPTAAHVGNITYLKVKFSDDTVWESSNIDFSKSHADIVCSNPVENEKLKAPDNKIYLADASTGSDSRSWYIWSDEEMGWVLFSNDFKPVLDAKTNVCIKLVINNDENIYSIKTFEFDIPKIAVTCYNTGETKYSDNELLSFATDEMTPPFKFALWDFADAYGERNWYMWSDEYGAWEFLSNERGPILDTLSKHPVCIKVEYNNDSFNYVIYNIYFQ